MIEALLILVGLAIGVGVTLAVRRRPRKEGPPTTGPRILFPFVGRALSTAALDAALRIARVEGATLVPVYLAPVPMTMPLDSPIGRTCDVAFELLEAIEQRAARAGVAVDGRIGRGRTVRHALRELLASERYDRIVVAAATNGLDGLSAEDVAWLLGHAGGEVVVLRPADHAALAAA
jgi:hypothetical protein